MRGKVDNKRFCGNATSPLSLFLRQIGESNITVDKKLRAKMWELILQGRCQLRADLLIPFGSPPRGRAGGRKTIIYVQRHAGRGLGASKSRATDIVFAQVGNFLRTSFHGGERGQVSNMPRLCRWRLCKNRLAHPPSRRDRPWRVSN